MILRIRDSNGNVQEILTIKGDSYVLTEADKREIANMVASMAVAAIDLPEVDLSGYYTKTEVNNLIPTVPTNVSAFANDAGYLTEAQVLELIQENVPASGDGVSY